MSFEIRVLIIEAENWCWCEQCDAPSTMTKNGRCARCTSQAVAFLDHLQVGEEAESSQLEARS